MAYVLGVFDLQSAVIKHLHLLSCLWHNKSG